MAWPTHIVAAAGYVFRGDEILIVKTHNRGWAAAGGQVENGESLEQGVLREIIEESGITARVKCLAGIYSNVGDYHQENGVYIPTKLMLDFICDYERGEPTISDETSEVKWVDKNDVMGYITAPAMRYRFQKILDFSGRVTYSSYVTRPEFRLMTERFV